MDPTEPQDRDEKATDALDWSQARRAQSGPNPPPTEHSAAALAPPERLGASQPRGGRLGLVAGVAAVAAIAGGLAGGLLVTMLDDGDSGATERTVTGPITQVSVEQTSAVTEVAAARRESIVRIESTRRVNGGIERDVGSGVIVDAAGHVVTNAHVVLGTETLKVFLSDGSERPAILIGHDSPFSDLAVIQIGPVTTRPAPFADSGRLVLGEPLVAIGNPLSEFEGSVTVGVVSGLNRSRTQDGVRHDDFIQTDAALNNGNSGGALFNLRGEFVGMPTLVLRLTASRVPVEGIGFAIPSNKVLEVANAIIAAAGPVARPTLGVDHVDLSPEVQARPGRLTVDTGALITSVTPGGPGAAAGIQSGDVVQKIGDQPVDREHPLLNGLLMLAPGDTVKVVLNRSGRIIEVEVRLGKRET